jgi:hypothetical protein
MKTEYFREDRDFRKQTDADRERIAEKTAEFLKNGGKVEKVSSGLQSGICDLSPKERSEICKKALNPGSKRSGK